MLPLIFILRKELISLVLKEERRSELFNLLAWMGLLSTEERRIRLTRESDIELYEKLDLTYEDIERVGYLNPHVKMKPEYKGLTELWIEDKYLNPQALMWIETPNGLYAVVDEQYDELIPVRCFYNPNILYRYNVIADNEDTEYSHVVIIDTSELKYSEVRHIDRAAYYISQNQICQPTVTWLDDHTVKFTAPYKHDIDFFICSNLVANFKMTANEGKLVDSSYSNFCYHRIIIDHDATYPIDARFYPCIKVDKDCTIRVYSDNYHTILYPDVSRLINYPEFYDVVDPYNTDNAYLNEVITIDDVITTDDSDKNLLRKFKNIASTMYRMWERFPFDTTEQSDFVICDNHALSNKAFVLRTVYTLTEQYEKICTTIPFEPFRDVLLYQGKVFSDFEIKNIRKTEDGNYVENNDTGIPTYLIDPSYLVDDFTLIKFNTSEDTNIMNIGDYVDRKNIAHLHYKLNRFYRNLLILRQQVLTSPQDEYVRIATEQPNSKDNYLWFELLVNAVPEMFETHPIDTIDLFGLDPDNIPDTVKNGAYMLELDPKDGPASYTDLLMTYYKLGKNKKQYLALQYGEGIDDPRVQVFHSIKVGKLTENEEMNTVVIEDSSIDPAHVETKYEAGRPDTPGVVGKVPGDLYVKIDAEATPPPGEENIDIEKISLGPNIPEPDDNTLWIDTTGNDQELPEKDSHDGETDTISIVNDPDKLEASEGDYTIDSNDDTLTIDQEGEISVDDLLDGLDESSEIDSSKPTEDLLGGISQALATNQTIDDIENPSIGQIALDDIQFYSEETNATVSMDTINAMSTDEKLSIVNKFITDDDTPESANIGDMWLNYLSNNDPMILNTVVYKVLLTAHVYNLNQIQKGDLALEGDKLPETEETIAYGEYPQWTKPDQMLIQPLGTDENGNVAPDYDMIREHNVKYIMNIREPDDMVKDDLWLQIPAATLKDIMIDVMSLSIMEIGAELPEGVCIKDEYGDLHATTGFDFYAHDKGTEGLGELFRERIDSSLHKVYFGDEIETADLKEDDVWYEFLDDINNKVCYSDQNSMVIRVNERLILIKFENNNIEAFAFDDILLSFRGKLGIKYLSILADLINSGNIPLDDVNIFYKRLITFEDEFDPRLKRLYTGTSHVVSTAKINTDDYSILYSTNIGRFRMDYSSSDTTNKERESAYRMCIDYRNRDFAFIDGRMLLFVNGKYIPRGEYTENTIGMIELLTFDEIIATVDILYSKKDQMLMNLKRCTIEYYGDSELPPMIKDPNKYKTMQPIKLFDYTKKGFYDILIDEFITNGKLVRILNYLEEHPEEAEDFKKDMVRKFHSVSDIDLCGINDKDARIIISGNSHNEAHYQIGE